MLQSALKKFVILADAGIQSHACPERIEGDVKPWTGIEFKSCSNGIGKLPSPSTVLRTGMAQDTGIPAGMTVLAEASS